MLDQRPVRSFVGRRCASCGSIFCKTSLHDPYLKKPQDVSTHGPRGLTQQGPLVRLGSASREPNCQIDFSTFPLPKEIEESNPQSTSNSGTCWRVLGCRSRFERIAWGFGCRGLGSGFGEPPAPCKMMLVGCESRWGFWTPVGRLGVLGVALRCSLSLVILESKKKDFGRPRLLA